MFDFFNFFGGIFKGGAGQVGWAGGQGVVGWVGALGMLAGLVSGGWVGRLEVRAGRLGCWPGPMARAGGAWLEAVFFIAGLAVVLGGGPFFFFNFLFPGVFLCTWVYYLVTI